MKRNIIFICTLIIAITLYSCLKEPIHTNRIPQENKNYWLNNAEYLAEQLCVYTPAFSHDIKIEQEDIIMAFIISAMHIDFEDYIYRDSYHTETDIFYKAVWDVETIQRVAYEVFGKLDFERYTQNTDCYNANTMMYSVNLETGYNKYFKLNNIDSKILDDKYILVTVSLSEDDSYEPSIVETKEEVEILFEYINEDTEFLRLIEYDEISR